MADIQTDRQMLQRSNTRLNLCRQQDKWALPGIVITWNPEIFTVFFQSLTQWMKGKDQPSHNMLWGAEKVPASGYTQAPSHNFRCY